jgi:hypothetical protein
LAELGLVRLKTATPSWRSEDFRPRSDIGSVNLTMDRQDELGNCCVTLLFGDGFFDVGTRMVDIILKNKIAASLPGPIAPIHSEQQRKWGN